MTKKHWAMFLAISILGICALGIGEKLSLVRETGLVSSAHAIVGRPLTPVSVAGVARRTARRFHRARNIKATVASQS